MARINKKVKLFIVRMLAEFGTPSETASAVKDIFDLNLTKQQCEAYDPTKRTGQDLSEELRELFFKHRRKANEELEAIPLANKRYRLQVLQGLVDEFPNNPVLTPKFIEQAAKEMGGLYTNRKEITGADGGAIQTETNEGQQAKPIFTPEQLEGLTAQELSRLAINGTLK